MLGLTKINYDIKRFPRLTPEAIRVSKSCYVLFFLLLYWHRAGNKVKLKDTEQEDPRQPV